MGSPGGPLPQPLSPFSLPAYPSLPAPPPFFESLCPPFRVALVGGGWLWALGIVDNTSPWAPQSYLPCITVTSVRVFVFLSLTSGSWGTGAFLYCVVTKVFQTMGSGLCPAFLPRSGLSGPRQGLLRQLRHYAGVLVVPLMRYGANCLCLSLGPPAQYLPETKRMLMGQLCNLMFFKSLFWVLPTHPPIFKKRNY